MQHERRLTAGLFGWCGLIALLDWRVAGSTVLISFLATGPLIAAARGGPRTTLIVSAWAITLALLLGAADGFFGSAGHVVRIGVVTSISALSVWVAFIRRTLERARYRDGLIADAGAVMNSALDYRVTLVELARLVSRRLSDWCFVFIKEDDGRIRQLAAAHVDPARERLARELLSRYPLDPERPEGPAKVIRSGQADLQPVVTDELLRDIAADEENMRLLKRLELTSAMVVPLLARGRILGAIAFASADSGRVFGEEDLALAEELGARAAMSVDNGRLYALLSGTERELRAQHEQIEAILGGVADAVTAQAPDGSLVYANDAAARQVGLETAEEMLRADLAAVMGRFELLDARGRPFPVEQLPGRRALRGEEPGPELVRYRVKATGEERWSLLKATAIRDDSGKIVLAINVVEDVTEERAAQERQRLLAETSGALTRSLDVTRTFPRVAELIAEGLLGWCVVELLERDGTVRTLTAAQPPAAANLAAEEMFRRYPVARQRGRHLGRELAAGRSLLLSDLSERDWEAEAQDPEHLALLRQLQPRSAMSVPLAARGHLLGAITVVTAGSGPRLDDDDLEIVEEIGGRCSLALDNSRLYEERSRIARTLQESLLPPLLPDLPGLDVAARFRAAGEGIEVGGDFYDLFELGPAGWAIAIGDVCGKGTGAAAVTALARYTVRTAAMRQDAPSQILGLLNEALLRQRTDKRFCTVLFGRISMNGYGASFDFASGGHPLPLLLKAGGGRELGMPGTLLGIVPDPRLNDEGVRLEPGDALVLYTDGVTDAGAPQRIWTPSQLVNEVGPTDGVDADAIAERVLRAALDSAPEEPRDDIAIVVLKVPEAAPS